MAELEVTHKAPGAKAPPPSCPSLPLPPLSAPWARPPPLLGAEVWVHSLLQGLASRVTVTPSAFCRRLSLLIS